MTRTDTRELPNGPADSSEHLPEPLLVDAKHTARLLGISERSWWQWVTSGRTPAPVPLPGRVRRWSVDELKGWIGADCPPRKEWKARREVLAFRTTKR